MSSRAARRHAHADLGIPRPKAALPLVSESLAPWLIASILISLVTIGFVVSGQRLPRFEQTMLLVGLFATMTAGALVVIRTDRERWDRDRDERERPATEMLAMPDLPVGTAAFVSGMEHWTAAMLELIEHALAGTDQGSETAAELRAAADDTKELRSLLTDGNAAELSINDLAMIRALCTLWEANQPWVEELAAATDDEWHERWAARTLADRRLRHGDVSNEPLALPYRS
jgi:hypothetical protein